MFEGDLEAIGARLARALHLLQRGVPLPEEGWEPLYWASHAHFLKFVAALDGQQESLRYVDLTRASLEEVDPQ